MRQPEVQRLDERAIDVRSSRRALLGAAGAFGALATVPLIGRLIQLGDASASLSKAQDAKILQLVLQLEYTQVAFYEEALRQAGLTGDLRDFARAALEHERQHLAAIRRALGAKAGAKPSFDFGQNVKSARAFTQAAIQLEDIAVAGYNGQATNLTKGTLAAAAAIVSVEARHAAWVRAIAGQVAAPDPVDKPMTAKQAAQGLHEIGLRT
jgi:ferritin-like protein